MSKKPVWHANERVDKTDLEQISEHAEGVVEEATKNNLLDNRSLVLNGFRVEVPNQTTFPGRIVIHGGSAYNYDGQLLFNEDQLNNSRTITLEGASNVFWVEIELVEVDSDLDSRAHWDPTVDQGSDVSGDDLPDGQEGNATVATRKTHDWRVVQPIRVGVGIGFERDNPGTLDSLKIPVVRLETSAGNVVRLAENPNIALESPRTTLVEAISATQWKVVDSRLFIAGDTINLGKGSANAEQVTISTINYETHLITTTVASNSHLPGDIILEEGGTPREIVGNALFGPYQRPYETNVNDYKDRAYAGDERRGEILTRGHDDTDLLVRSDTNLQTLKDQVDFLSAQIQEMKWGHPDPTLIGNSPLRIPPGVSDNFPTIPRYFDDAGGVQGARSLTVTVGNGSTSWGDFNSTNGTAIQEALDSLPAALGGTVRIKRGTYTLAADIDITNTGYTILEAEKGVIITTGAGGSVRVNTAGRISLRGLNLVGDGAAINGLEIHTTDPLTFEMYDCNLFNAQFLIARETAPTTSIRNCRFEADDALFQIIAVVDVLGANANFQGVFSGCLLSSDVAVASDFGLFNASTTAGQRITNASFVDCHFNAALINVYEVDLGDDARNIFFTRCYFTSTLGCTNHIRVDGGRNIKFKDCYGLTIYGGLVYADSVNVLNVDGYTNTNTVTQPVVHALNCNNVTIQNCDVVANGLAALTHSPFLIEYNTAVTDFAGVTIKNNKVEASTDLVTGVRFDMNGADGLSNVVITDNAFDKCECGIYFKSTPGSGYYYNLVIESNVFLDNSVGVGSAAYQDVGIIFDRLVDKAWVHIIDNHFTNMNTPNATTLLGGLVNRSAIVCLGVGATSPAYFEVNGNIITSVGNSANPLDNAAIRFESLQYSTINNNIIVAVEGDNAVGIRLSETTNTATNITVDSNTLDLIVSGAAATGIYGITASHLNNVVISNNNFSRFSDASGSTPASAIGSDGAFNLNTLSIVGNVFDTTTSTITFVRFNIATINNAVIKNNNTQSTTTYGVLIQSSGGNSENINVCDNNFNSISSYGIALFKVGAGGDFSNININNNNIVSIAGGVANVSIDNSGGAAFANYISVSNNNLNSSPVASRNVSIEDCYFITVDSNICILPDLKTVNNILLTNSTRGTVSSNTCYGENAVPNIGLPVTAAGAGFNVIGNVVEVATVIAGDNQGANELVIT